MNRSVLLMVPVALAVMTGCTATADVTTDATGTDPVLCAEFPPQADGAPGDAEGWWNGAPADADGNVIEDPKLWPDPRLREHPRVAIVAADGDVIATYDRLACGSDSDFVPDPQADWPADRILVLDMDTGEVLHDYPDRR